MALQRSYTLTVFCYKRAGTEEKEYHEYISKVHGGHLKALLAKKDILAFSMVSDVQFWPLICHLFELPMLAILEVWQSARLTDLVLESNTIQ